MGLRGGSCLPDYGPERIDGRDKLVENLTVLHYQSRRKLASQVVWLAMLHLRTNIPGLAG